MDFADVDSAKFETYGAEGSEPMSWVHKREGRLLSYFEHKVGNLANRSLFVAELFRERSRLGAEKVSAIGNGIDLDFYDPDTVEPVAKPSSGPLIMFTGQMDYRPNVEAVQSFANDAMPSIITKYPEARFAIVGRAPTDVVKALYGTNGVIVTGGVPDIREWLKAADMVVAPLRIARGIQNKVLEAMAMGKLVIASTAAAEGISAENGKHFLVARNVTEEAACVMRLIEDHKRANQIGTAAMQLIHSHYSWDGQLSNLHKICGFEDEKQLEAAE